MRLRKDRSKAPLRDRKVSWLDPTPALQRTLRSERPTRLFERLTPTLKQDADVSAETPNKAEAKSPAAWEEVARCARWN